MKISTLVRTARARVRKLSHNHPLVSNAILYGGLYTLAEVTQQKLRANIAAKNAALPQSYSHQGGGSSAMASLVVSPSTTTTSTTTTTPSTTTTATSSLTSSASHHRLDMSSVKRYAIMGTFVIPPILTKWYNWLDGRFPSTSKRTVLKKLILDQFLLTPWLLAMFFIGMSFLEGAQGQELLTELKQKFTMTFTLDCCYWLPVQALNFLFVPPMFRVLYIGVTTFIWMNILCFIKASPH